MTVGCPFADVVVNDTLTSTSKNMAVMEEGQHWYDLLSRCIEALHFSSLPEI